MVRAFINGSKALAELRKYMIIITIMHINFFTTLAVKYTPSRPLCIINIDQCTRRDKAKPKRLKPTAIEYSESVAELLLRSATHDYQESKLQLIRFAKVLR